jgi:integrase
MPRRYSTRRGYEVWLRLYILPRWGECSIAGLQARPVEMWLLSLELAPRSKSSIRGLLNILWDYAMWRGDVPTQRNPIQLVTIRGGSKRIRKPRSLTVEEFQLFIHCLDEPFRTIALMSVCFGLRISECLALKWLDLDWFNGTLSIQRAIVRQRLDDVKTMYSERSMAIDAAMLDVVKRWKQASQFSKPEDWMFASPAKLGRLPMPTLRPRSWQARDK